MGFPSDDTPSTTPSELLKLWVEEHSDYLYRYALRYIRNESMAEDLLQETFLAALEGVEKFEGRSKPRTWLTGILRHKILDRVRKNFKEEKLLTEPDKDSETLDKLFNEQEHWLRDTGPMSWSGDPDALLRQKQFLQALEHCLEKLPLRVRQIFLLRELDGLEREEISAELSLSSTNVGVILHRGRLALQHCLQSTWFLGSPSEKETDR